MTTAGGVEEDFVKCLGSTILGDFHLAGADLRKKGLNRIGNLLVPNSNYCSFEDWIMPILDQMVKEQEGEEKVKWTPSKVINRLGKEINNEESVYYWCWKVSFQDPRSRADLRMTSPCSALRSPMARSET